MHLYDVDSCFYLNYKHCEGHVYCCYILSQSKAVMQLV